MAIELRHTQVSEVRAEDVAHLLNNSNNDDLAKILFNFLQLRENSTNTEVIDAALCRNFDDLAEQLSDYVFQDKKVANFINKLYASVNFKLSKHGLYFKCE